MNNTQSEIKEFILPLRDLVMHPGTSVPVFVDNPLSIACIEAANKGNNTLVLVAQHSWNYPTVPDDLYTTGTRGTISQAVRMPDGAIHAIIKTQDAVNMSDITVDAGLFTAKCTPIATDDDMDAAQTLALRDRIAGKIQSMFAARKFKMDKLRPIIQNYPLPAFIDAIVQILEIDTDAAIEILRTTSWQEKLVLLFEQINLIAETAKIEEAINRRVNQQLERGQREAILQEKMRAIQREMGEDNDEMDAVSLRRQIDRTDLPTDVRDKALNELRRLRGMSPTSPEATVIKTYLDELLALPWGHVDTPEIDLHAAREILDAQHSGMGPIKERILEHIAVMKKTGGAGGTILCLVGAPGVGKTSLGRSVADALGRKYHRISLGGISDEAHLRGHRRTYLGSQPGRIIDALKRCKANNPVIVLDEIDKMARDYRGDPEAALLEILDPEQNKTFRDHFLEVDFDLSNIVFIATANSLNMSSALKDRMEIIEIPGYTMDEKVQIAREHLLSRAARDTGWAADNIVISDDAIRHIINKYTSEQGVRQLQRELTAVLRRALLENDGEDKKTEFTIADIDRMLSARQVIGASKKIGFSAYI